MLAVITNSNFFNNKIIPDQILMNLAGSNYLLLRSNPHPTSKLLYEKEALGAFFVDLLLFILGELV